MIQLSLPLCLWHSLELVYNLANHTLGCATWQQMLPGWSVAFTVDAGCHSELGLHEPSRYSAANSMLLQIPVKICLVELQLVCARRLAHMIVTTFAEAHASSEALPEWP